MARDPRVKKAFDAMKGIGIAPDVVKPVLKRLLTLYDKNWELIEEENYRALADAIFENENEEMVKKNDVLVLEPPLKKPHGATPEDQGSSTLENRSRRTEHEECEIPEGSNKQKLAESSQSASVNPTGEKRHETTDDEDIIRFERRRPNRLGSAADADIIRLERRRINCPETTDDEDMVRPERKRSNRLPLSALQPSNVGSDGHNQTVGLPCNYGANVQYTFDLASSSCGKVNICLRHDHVQGQPGFESPNLEDVLRYAENMCVRSNENFSRSFSMVQLMKVLCDSYLEVGTGSANISAMPSGSPDHILGPNDERPRTDNLEKNVDRRIKNDANSSRSHNGPVLSRDKRRPVHQTDDITNGTETVKISLLDETGREQLPDFVYIPNNTVYQSAYIHISLARISDEDCCSDCSEDCLSYPIPCACARDTGGEFAYTPEGLLRKEFLKDCISLNLKPEDHYSFYCKDCPLERVKSRNGPGKCKGHIVKRFIKECWRKCRCNMKCGNRVVQRGISRKLQVFVTTEGKGWGLRALEDLPEGAFVCEYVGEIMTNSELFERNQQSSGTERHTYPVLLDADWGSESVLKDEEALCLDATYYGNVARFINHRCSDANLIDIPVEVETPDHHYYHIAFFTKRKVKALEELTWDYGIDFDDHNHPVKAFVCTCGSPFCRDKKRKRAKAIAYD